MIPSDEIKSTHDSIEEEQAGTDPEFTIEDMLDDDEIVQQFRMNVEFQDMNFFTYETIKKLIDFAIKMPLVDDYKIGYKFPLNACDIICSNHTDINNIIFHAMGGNNTIDKTKNNDNNNQQQKEKEEQEVEEINNEDDIPKDGKEEIIGEDEPIEKDKINGDDCNSKEDIMKDDDKEKEEKEKEDQEKEEKEKEENDKEKEDEENMEEKEDENVDNQKENILDYLFTFIYSEEDNENHVLSGYFFRIFFCFLEIKCEIVFKYLYEDHPEHLTFSIKLLTKKSIGDFILRVLTYKEDTQQQQNTSTKNTIDYPNQKLLLLSQIIDELSISSNDDYYIYTMEMLTSTLATAEFHNFFLITTDSSPCLLGRLYFILNTNKAIPSRYNVISAFLIKFNETLLKASFPNQVTPALYYMINPSPFYDELTEIEPAQYHQNNIKVLFTILQQSNFDFLSDLGDYNTSNIVLNNTTYERPQKCLGRKRLYQVELYRSIMDIIINAKAKEYYAEDIDNLIDIIINDNTFKYLIEIFFLYDMNNLYQTIFRQIITIILNDHSPLELLTFVFSDTDTHDDHSLNFLRKLIENIRLINQGKFTFNSTNVTSSCSLSTNVQVFNDIMQSPNKNVQTILTKINKDILAFNEIFLPPVMTIFNQKLLLSESAMSFSKHFNNDPKEDDGLIYSPYSLLETNDQYISIYDEYKNGKDYKELLEEKAAEKLRLENLHKKQSSNVVNMNEDLNFNNELNDENIFEKYEAQNNHDRENDLFIDDNEENNLFDHNPNIIPVFQMMNSSEEITLSDLNVNNEDYYDNNYWKNDKKEEIIKEEKNKMDEMIMKELGI